MNVKETLGNFFRKCKTPKGLQIIAWSLATVLLIGSLAYYNFIDKPLEGKKKGDGCPEFTLTKFGVQDGDFYLSEETFNPIEHKGKVLVLNFWATNCQPCKEEIPHFNEFYEAYSQDVEVVIINGQSVAAQTLFDQVMNNEEHKEYDKYYAPWRNYTCTFAKYDPSSNDVLSLFAVTPALPVTVIVDRQGLIAELIQGSMSYERLESFVTPLL